MMNKRSVPHHMGKRLIQSAAVLGCTGLLYLQSSGRIAAALPISAEPVSLIEAEETEMPGPDPFLPIEGSLPIDGDYESAMLQVLHARPLYSTDSEEKYKIKESPARPMTWEALEGMLTTMTEDYEGTWSIYIKDLTTEETISMRDESMEAASLIKLYIMGAVMEKIHLGELEETDKINGLLDEMITVSDNEASNELVRYLSPDHDHREGMDAVNEFIRTHGFDDTYQINGLEDTNLWYSTDVNHTSVGDCGRFLEEVYNGTLVSHLASRKMENLLLAQDICYKIPDALPDEAVSANKTGEVTGTENDTAIIYSKGGDFILCIMSTDWSSQNQAIDEIHEITKTVYGYFNPELPPNAQIKEIENE